MAAEGTLVVVDSGPLIALAGADSLPLLKQLFARVIVPTVVRAEKSKRPHHRAQERRRC